MGNEWLGLTGLAEGLCKARRLHNLRNGRMQARCNCPARESDSFEGDLKGRKSGTVSGRKGKGNYDCNLGCLQVSAIPKMPKPGVIVVTRVIWGKRQPITDESSLPVVASS